MTKFSSMLIVLVMLALPGQALAQGSGDDVYTEDPPVAGNDNPPSGNDGGNSPSDGGSSPPSVPPEEIGAQGEDAAAAADLAESTDPDDDGSNAGGSGGSGSGDDGSGSSGSETSSGSSDAETSSGSSAGVDDVVVELADGSDDGAGFLLPIILGLVVFAGVAFVAIRRRGGSPGTA